MCSALPYFQLQIKIIIAPKTLSFIIRDFRSEVNVKTIISCCMNEENPPDEERQGGCFAEET